ncbi:MAG: S-adenosylmethionine decarboxylase [Nanoarchaeota archaeon]|nr:S-adenosylmethionine decarboxylase [Nanoarchaeota archaeon]MBU2459273.1 S-adenosylmethionine decarboxylase [Nanoarchaeota archaeon]
MQGQLTIINLNGCDKILVRDKVTLARYGQELCKIINMNPQGNPIVKRYGKGKLRGYTLVQLIETSSIVVHLDEHENKVFIDIFSCKNFDPSKVKDFSKGYFKAKKSELKTIMRK